MKETVLPNYKNCFYCGKENPLGLKLTFKSCGEKIFTETTISDKYIGYENTIHGGIIAGLVDEAMGWACINNTKSFYYTIDLSVKYIKPIRPFTLIIIEAWVTNSNSKKILTTESCIKDNTDKILIKATGKFYPAKSIENEKILKYLNYDL